MNMMNMINKIDMIDLINFDTKSLIGVLVWGNISIAIIVCLYQVFNNLKAFSGIFRTMLVIRLFSAVGYTMLFFRGTMSDLFSVNIGNSLLFLCHYLEARLILELVNISSKKSNIILSLILILDIFSFNIIEYYYGSASLRIMTASIIIFSLFVIPTIQIILSKQGIRFKKVICIFYVSLLFSLIPRSISSFLDSSVTIHSNNYYQTHLFMSLILMMISNMLIYFLFVKEKSDLIMEKMATVDSLTDILNRRSFHLQGEQLFDSHKLSDTPVALLFFDLDHFKNVNDTYGHAFGDEVLIRFADIIKRSIRASDLCCRYGGEEFLVLLANAKSHAGQAVADRIMQELERCTFETHPNFRVTTSAGHICGIPQDGEVLDDYINKGDKALYHAKKTGRNRMVSYDELPESPELPQD